MKLVVDTNILIRAVVCDDPEQSRIAANLLKEAELIAIALPCLCELYGCYAGIINSPYQKWLRQYVRFLKLQTWR